MLKRINQPTFLQQFPTLEEKKDVVGIIVYINSPGGAVFESDEVYEALLRYKEKTKKPVYAYFASLAASGGYYIGCAADKIIANRNTLTGSIGVIAGRFVDLTELMAKYGIKSKTIHAGRNKIMGSFDEPATEEQKQIGWNAKRELSKINYRIHIDAIKNNLIPKELSKNQINFVYAEEADVLNMALFGMTAKEWRTNNPDSDGNIIDYATMNELICLANLENLNSVFIKEGLKQSERL